MFEIEPFTRIVWKSQKDKDTWNPRIAAINSAYNKTELQTVIDGIRRATTMHIDMNTMQKQFEVLNENGLIFTPITQSGYYQGFSHKHRPVTAGQPSYWYGCVTKTAEDGRLFKLASNAKSQTDVHTPIGDLLGYPKCCTEKFIDIWETGNYDGMYEIACNTADSETNGTECTISNAAAVCSPLLRYFGLRAFGHFPCSLNCTESEKIAKKWLNIMNLIDSDAAEHLEYLLGSVREWNSLNGVVEISTIHFKGITHTYSYTKTARIIKLVK